MPDLGPIFASALELVTPLVKRALQSFLMTTLGMIALTLVVAIASVVIAAHGSWLRGALAAALAIGLGTVVGVFLSMKRAIMAAIIDGLKRLGLGSKMLALLFKRILGIDGEGALGQRGSSLAKAVERVPLAQAQARLDTAVRELMSQSPSGGGIRGFLGRKIQERVVRAVEEITLSRFRERGRTEGGVDLTMVRDELAMKIDGMLVEKLKGGILTLTLAAVGGVLFVSLLGAYGIGQLNF